MPRSSRIILHNEYNIPPEVTALISYVKELPLKASPSLQVVQPARSSLLLGALICLILALVLATLMIKPALAPSSSFPQPKPKTEMGKARRLV
jgi:hypothetical protein